MSKNQELARAKYFPSIKVVWSVLFGYVLFFAWFAWQDLYGPHVTVGLYATHYSPYAHPLGYVIDPKPNTPLGDELKRRLRLSSVIEITSLEAVSRQFAQRVTSPTMRAPNENEILVAVAQEELILVLNEYLGQWVTFRPSIGIVLENGTLSDIVQAGVVLKADPL